MMNPVPTRRIRASENEQGEELPTSPTFDANVSMNPLDYNEGSQSSAIPIALIPSFREMLRSEDPKFVKHGALLLKKVLAVNRDPPIDEVINSGAVPDLVKIIKVNNPVVAVGGAAAATADGNNNSNNNNNSTDFALLLNATWAISNLMSGTPAQTSAVLKEDPIPSLVALFSCADVSVAEQAIWAVGNLLGESVQLRDELIGTKHNVLTRLLAFIEQQTTTSLANGSGGSISALRNSVWATSNAVRGKPLPKLDLVAPAIPVLAKLISHADADVRIDVVWTLGYICEDGRGNSLDLLLAEGTVVPEVISLVQNGPATPPALLLPALRILASFPMSSKPAHNAIVMSEQVIRSLPQILVHPNAPIRKEALYIISNIAADEKAPLELLIECGAMREAVVRGLSEPSAANLVEATFAVANFVSAFEQRVQKENKKNVGQAQATFALLTNFILGSDNVAFFEHVIRVCKSPHLQPVANMLELLTILVSTEKFVFPSEEQEQQHVLRKKFLELGGLEAVEFLSGHHSEAIRGLASELLEFLDPNFKAEEDKNNIEQDEEEEEDHDEDDVEKKE